MLELSREIVEHHFTRLVEQLFSHPEIDGIRIRDTMISRDNNSQMMKKAVDKSYHDIYSDIDLTVVIRLKNNEEISPERYVMNIAHWFGDAVGEILGVCFVSEHNMYRIVLKNGIRYDWGFEFVISDSAIDFQLKPMAEQHSHENWPIKNINNFWLVQIQALGKLYRKDYLISSHLANVNINETLVQQMVLRDLEYHTNHHRYGYREDLIYHKYIDRCPFSDVDNTFDEIAKRLYAAAFAYDELVHRFLNNHTK